jgi:hypothetical protein
MAAITVVYDTEGWAWHRRALDLQEFAPPHHAVQIVGQARVNHQKIRKLRPNLLYLSWCDCPKDIARYTTTLSANPGINHSLWKNRNPDENPWIACNTTRSRNIANAATRFPWFKRVICLTPELEQIVNALGGKAVCIPTGINHRVFRTLRPLHASPRLRVGWCGQVNQADPYNQKGFKWVAEPVMEQCKGFADFQVNTNDYKTALSREQMVEWYNNIDVFLCTSIAEGTPTTAMEAMMCGRPVVTTAVGDMPQIIRNGLNGWMVPGYLDAVSAQQTISQLCDQLRQLHEDRNGLVQQGAYARQWMLEHRNWEQLAKVWLDATVRP